MRGKRLRLRTVYTISFLPLKQETHFTWWLVLSYNVPLITFFYPPIYNLYYFVSLVLHDTIITHRINMDKNWIINKHTHFSRILLRSLHVAYAKGRTVLPKPSCEVDWILQISLIVNIHQTFMQQTVFDTVFNTR